MKIEISVTAESAANEAAILIANEARATVTARSRFEKAVSNGRDTKDRVSRSHAERCSVGCGSRCPGRTEKFAGRKSRQKLRALARMPAYTRSAASRDSFTLCRVRNRLAAIERWDVDKAEIGSSAIPRKFKEPRSTISSKGQS